jgi:hypothetical protein
MPTTNERNKMTTTEATAPWDCSLCGQPSPWVNVGKTHVGYCVACGVSYIIGSNLLSSWQDETEEEQRDAYAAAGITTLRRIS